MSDQKRVERLVNLTSTFTPGAPVRRLDAFSGRWDLITSVFSVINQQGQHAALFGDRGVGKTSLANILGESFASKTAPAIRSVRFGCSTDDDFELMWRGLFRKLRIEHDEDFRPSTVVETVSRLDYHPLLVIDEIDRFDDQVGLSLLADTIKAMSDDAVDATIVVVGVSDSIEELIGDHKSVGRNLIQIRVPRMARSELRRIVDNGLERLGMTATDDDKDRIAWLSEGLPHYTHLLCLYAADRAIHDDRYELNENDLRAALNKSVDKAQDSIRADYAKAVRSPRRDSLFEQVLLACALAPKDDVGFFTPRDVRKPLCTVLNRDVPISSYMRHLNEFSGADHGRVLQKQGQPRKWVYRFTDPMVQPYVILRGLQADMITEEGLRSFRQGDGEIVPEGL